MFDASVFWPAFKAAGMLRPVKVKQAVVWVGYVEPDTLRFDQTRSTDYEIEYQTADLPNLAQGDPVLLLDAALVPIAKAKFRVREAPFVPDIPAEGNDGTFRRALLTKL